MYINNNAIETLSYLILPILFAITVHEAAHGWMASKLGDKTALMLGRVSLNPARHIDPLGTIVVPLTMFFFTGFMFGWAKPVPITWRNLKNPRWDMVWVALAGPGANLIMAFIWAAIAKLAIIISSNSSSGAIQTAAAFFINAGGSGILINILLMVLNLLPIQPLDGGRVVSSLLPGKLRYYYDQVEPYGLWILVILMITKILQSIIVPPTLWATLQIGSLFGLS